MLGRGTVRLRKFDRPPRPLGGEAEDQRVQEDRNDCPGQDQVSGRVGEDSEAGTQVGEDEGEFADLGEAGGDRDRGLVIVSEQPDDGVGARRFSDENDGDGRKQWKRLFEDHRRVEQHSNRHEEQDRECIA